MPLKVSEWHNRFDLQAGWTEGIRQHLFSRAGLGDADLVLDVGCGTGVLMGEISQEARTRQIGIDINLQYLQFAKSHLPGTDFTAANALHLPFESGTFACSFCHFVLMWITEPIDMIHQMKRVTKPGGAVIALAEPDYGGRIDYPPELEAINQWQTMGLRHLGADPHFGRKLKGLLHAAGLHEVETGVIGSQWRKPPSPAEIESEWAVIQNDLSILINKNSEVFDNSEALKEMDLQAWARGQRVLFVPTFYGIGWVPAQHSSMSV